MDKIYEIYLKKHRVDESLRLPTGTNLSAKAWMGSCAAMDVITDNTSFVCEIKRWNPGTLWNLVTFRRPIFGLH